MNAVATKALAVAKHPAALVAAGVGLGVLAFAMWPRKAEASESSGSVGFVSRIIQLPEQLITGRVTLGSVREGDLLVPGVWR